MERIAAALLVASPFAQADTIIIVIGVLAAAFIIAVFLRRKAGQRVEGAQAEERPDSFAQAAYFIFEDGIITKANGFCREKMGMVEGDGVCRYLDGEEQLPALLEAAERGRSVPLRLKAPGGKPSRFIVCCAPADSNKKNAAAVWGLSLEPFGDDVLRSPQAESEPEAETKRPTIEPGERGKNVNRPDAGLFEEMFQEFRMSVNGIISLAEGLLNEAKEERQSRYARDIKTSAESLLNTINDMLDISKISEGTLDISPVDTDLNELLKTVTTMMGFSAQSRGLDFIDDIRVNSPEYVLVDDVRLKQILTSLLSSVIRFTKEGYVKFAAKIEDENIVISVSDTNADASGEGKQSVFMTFGNTNKTKDSALDTLEPDLSLSKSLVELMDGKIWAEGEHGTGATLFVTVPYKPGDGARAKEYERYGNYIFAPTAEVLLVDDIQSNLAVLAGMLRLFGIAADVALSGREAIELVTVKDYDMVFMDHMMPEMDGVQTMQAIRCMGEKHARLPIIAVTANPMDDSKEFLLASGMNDFLRKPIDKELLSEALKKWLPAEKVEKGAVSAPKPAAYSPVLAAASEIEGLDINLALSRISYMQDVLEESIKLLAYALGERLTRMEYLLSSGDMRGLTIESHGLKGSLANIGATRNSVLATELELAARAGDILLCEQKFGVFRDVLKDFAEQLKSIFPNDAGSDKQKGDRQLLEMKVREALDCLARFEAKEALKLLDEICEFTYGVKADASLSDARSQIEIFKYKNAAALLQGALEE